MNPFRFKIKTVVILLLALAFLISLPLFFEIYREAAFNSVPRDDYASFLQALVGRGGSFPGSPYAYRILSVLVAVPFFYVLPLYPFTNLTAVDPIYLQAVEALAMVSYLSILLTAMLIFLIARRKFHASLLSSALVALAVPILSYSISRPGIDPLAVLWIALLVYAFRRPRLFIGLVLISSFVNEKIPILFCVVTVSRWIWLRLAIKKPASGALRAETAASALALLIYFVARGIFQLPGFENQANIGQFFPQILASAEYFGSLKGVVLNLAPVVIVFALILLSVQGESRGDEGQFYPADAIGALALLVLGLGTDLQFTVGRIVMFAYPLYLPAIALLLDRVAGTSSIKAS
jgi:hypothetical protein